MTVSVHQPSDADATIVDDYPTTNYGTGTTLSIGPRVVGKATNIYRSLLLFDISGWAGGALTDQSKLQLYLPAPQGYAAGGAFKLHRLTQTGWVESEVTWNQYAAGSNWGTAGGDFASGGADEVAFTGPVFNEGPGWFTIQSSDLTAWLQNILDSYGGAAHMILKRVTETGTDQWACWSNDYAVDTSLCPKLTLSDESGAVPSVIQQVVTI